MRKLFKKKRSLIGFSRPNDLNVRFNKNVDSWDTYIVDVIGLRKQNVMSIFPVPFRLLHKFETTEEEGNTHNSSGIRVPDLNTDFISFTNHLENTLLSYYP